LNCPFSSARIAKFIGSVMIVGMPIGRSSSDMAKKPLWSRSKAIRKNAVAFSGSELVQDSDGQTDQHFHQEKQTSVIAFICLGLKISEFAICYGYELPIW
jgi:hypothetical protein